MTRGGPRAGCPGPGLCVIIVRYYLAAVSDPDHNNLIISLLLSLSSRSPDPLSLHLRRQWSAGSCFGQVWPCYDGNRELTDNVH